MENVQNSESTFGNMCRQHQATFTLNQGAQKKKLSNFTLIELLVVIGVIAILAGMLLPTLITAKKKAARVQCTSNLDSIGKMVFMYADDWDQYIPPATASGYSGGSTTLIRNASGDRVGLGRLDLSTNEVYGCTAHDPRQADDVVDDLEGSGEVKSAYLYRGTDPGDTYDDAYDMKQGCLDGSNAYVISNNNLDDDEIAHKDEWVSVLKADGCVEGYSNEEDDFTHNGTDTGIDDVWDNTHE